MFCIFESKGVDIVLLMEDKERNDRLDLLEMSYYRELIVNDALSEHLDVAELKKTNQFSCRSESAVINYDNVGILSSIASQQIKLRAKSEISSIGIWHIDESSGMVCLTEVKPDSWEIYRDGDCSIYICGSFRNDIEKKVHSAGIDETGGCVFGCYDRDRRIIYVIYATSAPEDSIATTTSFIRGTTELREFVEDINQRTYFQVRYLGEWHSHPNSSNHPSCTDDKQFRDMSKIHSEQDIPFVQIIYGTNGLFVRCKM